MKKILTVLLTSIIICIICSITAFAEEAQNVTNVEQSEVRYVTSSEVNFVFTEYVDNFESLSDSDTVTKEQLYKCILNKDGFPVRITLDLYNYPEDLITEEELFMYIEEFEKADFFICLNEIKKVEEESPFNNDYSLYTLSAVLVICTCALIWIISLIDGDYNYHDELSAAKDSLKSIANTIKNKK